MFHKAEPHMKGKGWIGVDLDGTLAHYEGWNGVVDGSIGKPIPRMVDRVLSWLREGKTVKIFTARIAFQGTPEQRQMIRVEIETWCHRHLGQVLEVTATKDMHMVELWDDRCVQIVSNTGLTITEHTSLGQFDEK